MTIRTTLLAAAFTAACGLAPCTAQSQDPKAKTAKDEDAVLNQVRKGKELIVIRLKHAEARHAAQTIGETFKQSMVHHIGPNQRVEDVRPVQVNADTGTNSLIVMASETDLLAVRKLVAEIDIEDPRIKDGKHQTRVIKLKNDPDQALTDLLKMTGHTYSIDRARRQVVAIIDEANLQRLTDLISRWDIAPAAAAAPPAGDVQIRLVWLVNSADENNFAPAPDDLKPLFPALKKVGIQLPRVFGTFLVNVSPKSDFAVSGQPRGSDFTFSGRFDDSKSPPALSIQIRELDGKNEVCNLKTSLAIPMGHLIVLGTTTVSGLPTAFVLQVTRQESFAPTAKP